MKAAVRYYTKTGNTKKLAESIARALDVAPLPVSEPLTEDVDLLFLGSSVYGAGVADEIKDFIASLDVTVGSVVSFSTAAFMESTYKQIQKLTEAQGLTLSDQEFHCRGSFKIIHRKKPDEADLQAAAAFARRVAG